MRRRMKLKESVAEFFLMNFDENEQTDVCKFEDLMFAQCR